MKKYWLALVAVLALASVLKLWARPIMITCPRDGMSMSFDHQVGFGASCYAWYSHMAYDANAGGTVKHEAYVPCD